MNPIGGNFMRVNIDGRGAFPGIGLLPARNVELSDDEIIRLTNFKNVRVYDAATGVFISKKTILDKQKKAAEKKAAAPAPVVEQPKPVTIEIEEKPFVESAFTETALKEEPLPEVPKEAYVEPAVELDPVVTVEETAEEVVEEKTEEEKPAEETQQQYRNYKKKNKKNRNYNNTDAE
jgi:predicted DNA-binding protein (UPF0251 family)